MLDFEVPLCKDDLTSDRWKKSSWYYVKNIYNIGDLASKLSEFDEALDEQGIQIIMEHFDTLFSFLIHFTKIEKKMQFKCWTVISKALGIAIKELGTILGNNDIEDCDRVSYLNATKMLIYIFTQCMTSFEDSIINIGKTNKKESKKLYNSSCDWREKLSNEALIQLYNLIHLPIQRLWNPPCCEQSFTEMIGHACFKVLEDASTAQVRLKHMCETIFQIIGVLVKKHNFGLSCVVRIGQMLNLHEHSVSQLVKCVLVLLEEFECQRIVSEIMEEISRLDPGELTTTSLSAKTYSQFIMELTSEVPSQILEHIKKLEIMLSGESYTIRNGVLYSMGEIVLKCLSYENLSADLKKKRDNILNHLEDHIYDVNAFVRTKTLQIWKTLLKGRGIPLSRHSNILEKAVGRLKDKSVFVKKSAVQLVSSFLEENPFAAKLNLEQLKSQLNVEEEALNVLYEKEKNSQSALMNEIEQSWAKIQEQLVNSLPEIFEKVSCHMEDEMEIDEEDNDVTEICSKICEYLSTDDYLKAYSYLRVMEQYLPSAAHCFKGCENNEELLETSLKMFHKVYVMYHSQKNGLNEDSYTNNDSETPLQKEIREQIAVIDYLKGSINFVILMDKALPDIAQFLHSQQSSEVIEAIDFFCRVNQFGFSQAEKYMEELLFLVLLENENITKAVADSFQKVYFSKEGFDNRGHATQIVKNLCKFISTFSLAKKTALDCLIVEWVKKEVITSPPIQVMWEWVAMKDNKSSEDSRNALILLETISKEKPEIMNNRIPAITTLCLGERGLNDFLLASTACRIIGCYSEERLPDDHAIFTNLRKVLYSGFTNLSVPYYNKMASDAIEMIYKISLKPVLEMEMLIKNLAEHVRNSEAIDDCSSGRRKCDVELMSRLIFVVGHIALRQMTHLQDFVYNNLKKVEQTKKKNKKMNKTKNSDEEETDCTQANDHQFEQINYLCENAVVSGSDNLLSVCSNMIIQICSKPGEYHNTNVLVSAFLALAKMMMVSSEFCSNNIQLFMTALKDAEDDVIRMNCLIAVGDIAFRFPNIIEPWTVHLSASLLDKSVPVRATAVLVLTHLILNDMVLIKGQVTELAMCIVDENEEISHVAKVFFSELTQKGNTLYNALPDIISRLSNPEINFDSKKFCDILKYILGLVQRERQLENLVEKLCQRLGTASNDKQAEDISYCMSLLSYNEKSLGFLLDNIKCYGDKLRHKPVLDHFNTIMSGVSNISKVEVKTLCDELNFHIQNIVLGKTQKVDDGSLTLSQYQPPKTPLRRKGKQTRNPKSSTRKLPRKRRHKTTCSESEDSEE